MPGKECLRIMDMIDGGEKRENSLSIGKHLEKCSSCRAYYEISSYLNSAEISTEKIELWNEFTIKRDTVKRASLWQRPAFAVLTLVLIFSAVAAVYYLGPSAVKNSSNLPVTAGHQPVISSGIEHTGNESDKSDLDYYYEISVDI